MLRLHVLDGIRTVEIGDVIAALEVATDHFDSFERRRRTDELADALRHLERVGLDELGLILAPKSGTGFV